MRKSVNEKSVEYEVTKVMEGLDKMPNLTADPYFYSRLEQKLRRDETAQQGLMGRLLIGFHLGHAILLAIFLANLAAAYFALHDRMTVHHRAQYIESLASQYLQDRLNPLSLADGNKGSRRIYRVGEINWNQHDPDRSG